MRQFILRNFTLIRTLVAIGIGLAGVMLVIVLISATPGISLESFLFGPFRSRRTMATILETASPIIFAGLAIAVSFRAQQFYIGAEGAMYITAAVGTAFAVSTSMPWFLHVPVILLVSALVGGLWGAIPGFLKARFNASEIVSALMLNFVAYYGGLYLINYHFRDLDAGYMVSLTLPESAWLAQFVEGTRIHWGIVLALLAAVAVYYLFFHTTTGYEIRMTGHNQRFARFGGVKTFKVIILVHVLTGVIAGVGGMTEVMGIHHRFNWQLSPGYGWDGVIVAIIGRNHPFLIVPASLFLAYLRVGGQQLKLMSDVPGEIVLVIQSVIILLITAQAFLGRWRSNLVIAGAEEEQQDAEQQSAEGVQQ